MRRVAQGRTEAALKEARVGGRTGTGRRGDCQGRRGAVHAERGTDGRWLVMTTVGASQLERKKRKRLGVRVSRAAAERRRGPRLLRHLFVGEARVLSGLARMKRAIRCD